MKRYEEAAGSPPITTSAEQDECNLERTPADTLSQKGALALAKRLQDYWHAEGFHAVRFWTEPVGERFSKVGSYELYRVACNLVNGKPPQYREDTATSPTPGRWR